MLCITKDQCAMFAPADLLLAHKRISFHTPWELHGLHPLKVKSPNWSAGLLMHQGHILPTSREVHALGPSKVQLPHLVACRSVDADADAAFLASWTVQHLLVQVS